MIKTEIRDEHNEAIFFCDLPNDYKKLRDRVRELKNWGECEDCQIHITHPDLYDSYAGKLDVLEDILFFCRRLSLLSDKQLTIMSAVMECGDEQYLPHDIHEGINLTYNLDKFYVCDAERDQKLPEEYRNLFDWTTYAYQKREGCRLDYFDGVLVDLRPKKLTDYLKDGHCPDLLLGIDCPLKLELQGIHGDETTSVRLPASDAELELACEDIGETHCPFVKYRVSQVKCRVWIVP